MNYRFSTYSDLPPGVLRMLSNVVGVDNVTDLTLTEINNIVNSLEDFYTSEGQDFKDFIE